MLNSRFLVHFVVILVQFLLIIIFLSACGSASPTPASTTPSSTTKAAEPSPTNPATTAAATTVASTTPSATPAKETTLTNYLQNLVTTYDVPGAAVALVKDGKIIYAQGFGKRSPDGPAVTANTLFAIGSITKSFTALAIMQQIDQAKIDLDAPVVKYLPEFKLSDAEATQKVTVRQLLSMSSGLPRSDEEIMQNKSRQEVLANLPNLKLTAKPGELYQYSNQGYTVLGLLLEKVTGQSYESYLKQNILEPLGMRTALLDVESMQKAADFASPQLFDVFKGPQTVPFVNLRGFAPAGAINASASEMAEYVRFQLGDGTLPNGKRLVSAKSFAEMHTAQTKIMGSTSYALGWVVDRSEGKNIVTHNGGITGFSSNLNLVPEAKVGMIVLVLAAQEPNVGLFNEAVTKATTNWLLDGKLDPTLPETLNKQANFDPAERKANIATARSYQADPASFKPLLGEYNGSLGRIVVTAESNKLVAEIVSGSAKGRYTLIPFKPNFFLGNTNGINGQIFQFQTDASDSVSLLQEGTIIGTKLGPNATQNQYKDPQGRFSVVVPTGLKAQTQGDLGVLESTNPPGVFKLAAIESKNPTLAADVQAFLTKLDPNFKAAPVDERPVPVSAERTWTQFLYELPDDQLLAVIALREKNQTYFILAQAKIADVAALTPNFNTLILSFNLNN